MTLKCERQQIIFASFSADFPQNRKATKGDDWRIGTFLSAMANFSTMQIEPIINTQNGKKYTTNIHTLKN